MLLYPNYTIEKRNALKDNEENKLHHMYFVKTGVILEDKGSKYYVPVIEITTISPPNFDTFREASLINKVLKEALLLKQNYQFSEAGDIPCNFIEEKDWDNFVL